MSKAMLSDPITPSPRIEVITSVQHRRRWSNAEKVRLVEEAMQPVLRVVRGPDLVGRHQPHPVSDQRIEEVQATLEQADRVLEQATDPPRLE